MIRFTPPLLLVAAFVSIMVVPAADALAEDSPPQTIADVIERIKQADANCDGNVTRGEFTAYRVQQFSRIDRNSDGFIDMQDVPRMMASRVEPRLKQVITQFDADHDGRVSRDEFVNGPARGFDFADANHDGVVTQEEMRAALAKATAKHGQ